MNFARGRALEAEKGGERSEAGLRGEGTWAGSGPKQRRRILIRFLFYLIGLMNFVLLKLFIELRKFTGNFRRVY